MIMKKQISGKIMYVLIFISLINIRKQSIVLTTEAACLPVFHKMPGSQENFGKNRIHRQTVVGPQMPW
jgi:hypothetical protein